MRYLLLSLLFLTSNVNHWVSIEYFAKEYYSTFYPLHASDNFLLVSIKSQYLFLFKDGKVIQEFPISSSKYGLGSKPRSFKTPLGLFSIAEKIGQREPIGTVFYDGISSNKSVKIHRDSTDLDEDLVITRIIKLEGLEPGFNKGPGCDTYSRKIYIHGTPEEGLLGSPNSHGCIRMSNIGIIQLFDQIDSSYQVLIVDQ